MNKKNYRSIRESNTCIAVIREKYNKKKKGELVFAADRRISFGHSYQEGVRPKVVKRDGIILAGTGLGYLCNLACELTPIPKIPIEMDSFAYVHGPFKESLKIALISHGCSDINNQLAFPEDINTTILIGVKSDLYIIGFDSDFGILIDPVAAPYGAGCGGMYALGSLMTTENIKMSSEDRLTLALQVAAKLSSGCDDQIDIVRESDEEE